MSPSPFFATVPKRILVRNRCVVGHLGAGQQPTEGEQAMKSGKGIMGWRLICIPMIVFLIAGCVSRAAIHRMSYHIKS